MTVKRYEMNHKGLPEEDANGSFVLWSDHQVTVTNLTAQVQGLVADNSVLLKFVSQSCYSYDGDGSDVCDSYISAEEPPWFPKTPTTDAELAEIRAQGVEMFAAETIRIGEEEQDEDIIYAGKQAQLYAQQLRKEQGK